MAFWKKSEDPWDIDLEKRRTAPALYEQDPPQAEESPGLLTAWYCRACEKMAINAAGMQPPYGLSDSDSGWDGATVIHPGVEEDETQE